MRRLMVLAALAVFGAPAVRADGLAELRACLAGLAAHDPIRATVTVEVRPLADPKAKDRAKQEPVAIAVEAAAGADGITVEAPAGLLVAVREARHARRAGGGAPATLDAALAEVRFDALEGRLDAGRALAASLDGAAFLAEAPDTFRGDSVRLLTLRPASEFDDEARKHIKRLKEELRVWLAGDGCPLASEAIIEGQARFLVVSAEFHVRSRTEFARTGDRLFAAREEREVSGEGMGQHDRDATTVTVVPHPGGDAAPTPAPTGQPTPW